MPRELDILDELQESYIFCPHSLIYHAWPAPRRMPAASQIRALNTDYNALLKEMRKERERDFHEAVTLKEVLLTILSSECLSFDEAHKLLSTITARLLLLTEIKSIAFAASGTDGRRAAAEAARAYEDANRSELTSSVHTHARQAAIRAINAVSQSVNRGNTGKQSQGWQQRRQPKAKGRGLRDGGHQGRERPRGRFRQPGDAAFKRDEPEHDRGRYSGSEDANDSDGHQERDRKSSTTRGGGGPRAAPTQHGAAPRRGNDGRDRTQAGRDGGRGPPNHTRDGGYRGGHR